MAIVEKGKKLTKSQLKELETEIVKQESGLIYTDVVFSDEFNLPNEELSDDVDLANAANLSNHNLRFRNRELFYQKKLREAHKRIKKGEYGICKECEEPIGFQRLMARPTAELCISCKEEAERDEAISFIGRKSKSLGDRISISEAR